MLQAAFRVRMDESLKRQFDELCSDFGMSATTAFHVFARAVVRERRIPFEIRSDSPSGSEGKAAFHALRAEARADGLQDMFLEEIHEAINDTRSQKDRQDMLCHAAIDANALVSAL